MKHLLYFFLFCFLSFCGFSQAFSPDSIAGLKLWVSSDSVVKDGSNKISKFYDKSGTSNDVVQADSNAQPNLINNSAFSIPVAHFDGNSDFMSYSELTDIRSCFFVLKHANGNSTNYPVILGHSSTYEFEGFNGTFLFWDQFASPALISGQGFVNSQATSPATILKPVQFTLVSVISTGNLKAEYLSSPRVNAEWWEGDFAEIIIYNQPLTSTERQMVEQYLYNKYAPPVNLGNDTILSTFCPFTLKAKNTFTRYVWNNNTSLSSNQLIIDSSGTYTIETEDVFGRISYDTITVNFPAVNSIANNSLFCQGDSLMWNTTLPNNLFTFQWSNSSTDSLLWISQQGQFSVQITDTIGCSFNSDIITIIQDSFASVATLGADTSLCSGNTIALTSGSQPGITYQWSDNSTNNYLTIVSSGEYYVTATNSNNCVAEDTINITIVGQAPIAGFVNSITCENTSINFTDTSIAQGGGTIINWFWNFGDATATNDTSITPQPNFTYSDTGSYTINLTVTSNVGCKQNISKNIYIYPKPIVDFINIIACKNDTAFFSEAINPLGYAITNYQWSFGDGATSTSSDPFHIFSQNTNYQVQLIATNSQGCVNSITKTITVRDEVSADFNYSSACINAPITFTDNSIAPSPNASNIRSWAFFPGTATGLSATKTFTSAGMYPVRLTVTGFNNCVSSITKTIEVFLPPDADFTNATSCVLDSFQLTDVSLPINGAINSWQWKYAGNIFSTNQHPKYILNTTGNSTIFLKVSNDKGCIDSISKIIYANPLPDASFEISPSTYLFNDSPITLTPNFSSAVSYFWNVSDGNTYSDPSLSLTFVNQGAYTVSLQLTDNLGCTNNSSQAFSVGVRNTDLGIIAARSTIDNDGFVGVEADLFNYGSSPITTFEILYELTGGGIMKETWVVDTLPPTAVLLFKFSAKSFLNVNERKNAISCIKILTVNNVIDDNISNNENCAALNSDKQLVAEPFPNPADGDVTLPIVLTEDKTINITIYDYLGKLIAENLAYEGVTGLNFIKIPSATYSSGTYTLKISISDNNYIRKLIKQGASK